MSSNSFRDYLLPADAPRILAARNVDVATYGARMLATEKARDLQAQWQASLDETFRGITTDGRVREGLFALADEGLPSTRRLPPPESCCGRWSRRSASASASRLMRRSGVPGITRKFRSMTMACAWKRRLRRRARHFSGY